MFQKKRKYLSWRRSPYEGKELSKDKPIVKAQPGNFIVYYVESRYIGAPGCADQRPKATM